VELRDKLAREIFRHQLSWKRTEWGSISCCSALDCDWEFQSHGPTFEQHVADVVLAMARVETGDHACSCHTEWPMRTEPCYVCVGLNCRYFDTKEAAGLESVIEAAERFGVAMEPGEAREIVYAATRPKEAQSGEG